MKLCGLDFETANSCNGSICSADHEWCLQLCAHHSAKAHSHNLNCMADMFAIIFQHHDALEDAESCAKKIRSPIGIPENFICRIEYLQNA